MKYFKKLVGERLYLSPRNVEDVELYTEWLNDFQVTDYTGRSDQTVSLEGERQYLISKSTENSVFCIVTLDGDKMIGSIGIENIRHAHRRGTLGIFIGDENYRNKGYGSEAIRLILDYAFNYLNLYSVRLDVMEFNSRAINCYKRCGFKEAGRIRKCNFINGKYYDTIVMDILANEFNGDFIKNKNIK